MTVKLVVFSTDWPVWVHNDSLYPMFMLILFGIQGFAKGLFLALLYTGIAHIFNPEYYAIEFFIDLVNPTMIGSPNLLP